MLRILVNILIRQAKRNAPDDPATWLGDLQAGKWGALNAQTGQITSTMVNGKSVTIQATPGCSLADILAASELAIQCIQRGLDAMPSRTRAVLG